MVHRSSRTVLLGGYIKHASTNCCSLLFRYNAQLVAAAGVLLKKALVPDGPTGFWPLLRPGVSGNRMPKKVEIESFDSLD